MRECVCLAGLQGGQADAGEVGWGKAAAASVVTSRGLRDGARDGYCATWGDLRAARYNRPMPKKVGAAAVLSRLEA